MADVTNKRTGELLQKLFEIVIQHPDGLQAREALAALEKSVTLTPYEAGNYESGGRRFDKIVRFSTVDTTKAGWLSKSKGKWSITEEGKAALLKYKDPETFYREATRLYRQWKNSLPNSEPSGTVEAADTTSGKTSQVTLEEAEEHSWAEIESFLKVLNPYDFQDLVAGLLQAMGYFVTWIAPPGKDGGIDIIASLDPLSTRPPRIKVQVKRQQDAIRVDELRSFLSLLTENDVGLFVSLGGFTKDAEAEARTQQTRRITLIDAEKLVDLWTEHYSKLNDTARRKLPLQPIWFLAAQD